MLGCELKGTLMTIGFHRYNWSNGPYTTGIYWYRLNGTLMTHEFQTKPLTGHWKKWYLPLFWWSYLMGMKEIVPCFLDTQFWNMPILLLGDIPVLGPLMNSRIFQEKPAVFLWNTNHNTSKSPTSRFHSCQHVFFHRRSQILVHGIWMILDGLCGLFILILDDPWFLRPGRRTCVFQTQRWICITFFPLLADEIPNATAATVVGCPSNFLDASIQRPSNCPLWGVRTSPKWVEDTAH